MTFWQYALLVSAVWLAPNCDAKARLLIAVLWLGVGILSKVL